MEKHPHGRIHEQTNVAHTKKMRILESLASGLLLRAGLASAQTKYADNQVPVVRDGELVSKLFPDPDVELLSPAFADPGSVPAGWGNGTSGPTDQKTLGEEQPTSMSRP